MMTELTYLQVMEINLGHACIVLLKTSNNLENYYYIVVIQKQKYTPEAYMCTVLLL